MERQKRKLVVRNLKKEAQSPKKLKKTTVKRKTVLRTRRKQPKLTSREGRIAVSLAERGWTDKEIRHTFKVTKKILADCRYDPEFYESFEAAKEKAVSRAVDSLYQRAIGYTVPEEKVFTNNGQVIRVQTFKHYPPDVGAQKFLLTNIDKDNWKPETSTVINNENNNQANAVTKVEMSKEELDEARFRVTSNLGILKRYGIDTPAGSKK